MKGQSGDVSVASISAVIQQLQLKLLHQSVDDKDMVRAAAYLDPQQYLAIVDERSASGVCGYPPCHRAVYSNSIDAFSAPMTSALRSRLPATASSSKLYDMSSLKLFCCQNCLIKSRFFQEKLVQVAPETRARFVAEKLSQKKKNKVTSEKFNNVAIPVVPQTAVPESSSSKKDVEISLIDEINLVTKKKDTLQTPKSNSISASNPKRRIHFASDSKPSTDDVEKKSNVKKNNSNNIFPANNPPMAATVVERAIQLTPTYKQESLFSVPDFRSDMNNIEGYMPVTSSNEINNGADDDDIETDDFDYFSMEHLMNDFDSDDSDSMSAEELRKASETIKLSPFGELHVLLSEWCVWDTRVQVRNNVVSWANVVGRDVAGSFIDLKKIDNSGIEELNNFETSLSSSRTVGISATMLQKQDIITTQMTGQFGLACEALGLSKEDGKRIGSLSQLRHDIASVIGTFSVAKPVPSLDCRIWRCITITLILAVRPVLIADILKDQSMQNKYLEELYGFDPILIASLPDIYSIAYG